VQAQAPARPTRNQKGEAVVKRPLGVTIIAILLFIAGVSGILSALAGFGVFGGHKVMIATPILLLIVSLVQMSVASGLWQLLRWAWLTAVVVVVVTIIVNVIGIFAKVQLPSVIISLVIDVIVLLYLNSGGVRRAFAKP
jgi:hypothetical protein